MRVEPYHAQTLAGLQPFGRADGAGAVPGEDDREAVAASGDSLGQGAIDGGHGVGAGGDVRGDLEPLRAQLPGDAAGANGVNLGARVEPLAEKVRDTDTHVFRHGCLLALVDRSNGLD